MPTTARQPMPASLYAATIRRRRDDPVLTRDETAQVTIVGGGYTGLSAALHLAEAGVDVIVVEANEIGWGASGRNGGQVNPGLKWTPDQLDKHFGPDFGGRLGQFGGRAPDIVFDLIARHKIDCQPMRTGTIRAAVSPKSEQGITDLHRQLQLRGARIELLNATEMAAKSGTSTYPLGLFYPHGGNLNPLAYAYGLADAALKAGARIFAGTRATGLTKSGDTWTIATPSGSIRARQVILAGNGYTDGLWPGLRQSIVPVHSSITATAPLPPQIAAEIMPSRSSLYEISSTYTYYRIDADGRFLMGGRGVLRDSANSTDFQELVARAVHLFPALKRAEWQYFWNGRTAMTWDHLPHIHEPTEGLRIGLGYNGRGIAMATAVGNMLAERANGAPAEALDLPVTPVKPIFGHGFWPFAVRTRLAWERLRERTGV